MKIRNAAFAFVVALVTAGVGVACSADSNTASPTSSVVKAARRKASEAQELTWGGCTNRLAKAAKLECATLSVPLDPKKPDGTTIDLALARQAASGEASERIGSLLLNPGGPGGSGIEFLAAAVITFPDALKARFDLVSFDPRGVGESTPVRCLSDAEKEKQLEGDLSPTTPSEVDDAFEEQKEMLEGCEKNSPELLTHMSTADVAADLDRIREAVGDDKLSYVGFSYGTAIGAVYATLFPENTRALVLDGSVSPEGSLASDVLTQTMAFEKVLADFETACDNNRSCALSPSSKSVIDRTRKRLDKSPLNVKTDTGVRVLGVDQFDVGLATGLYDTSLWGVLADAIANIDDGGASMLFALMDQQTGRNDDGTFNNSTDAQTMVNCADTSERPTREEAVALAEQVGAAAPTFGEAFGWSALNCTGWPEASNPVPAISGAGAAPILVVGTKGDPATPYAWSEQMATTLQSATLLTYEGSGHTAFTRAGSCIDDAVVDYLIDLKVPPAGTSCPATEKSVSFDGLGEQIVSTLVKTGLPEEVARCIVNSAVADLGESEFNRMMLSQDEEGITQVIMAKTLSCVKVKSPR